MTGEADRGLGSPPPDRSPRVAGAAAEKPVLTEQERAAFCPELTRDRALDYFYVFDNVPLHFAYRDWVIPGEPTELERRNRELTETVWTQSYHQYVAGNVVYLFLYRGAVVQLPLQVHQLGSGAFTPAATESRPSRATAREVRAAFEGWMGREGWALMEKARAEPVRASWHTVLHVPDRTMRIASLIAVGNQVLAELIVTWSEGGSLRETAFAAVLLYDTDGTVLQDRSYLDMTNWPSSRRFAEQLASAPRKPDRVCGVVDAFHAYHRGWRVEGAPSDVERRNLSLIETEWVEAQNGALGATLLHPERFRLQCPLQKRSCDAGVAQEVDSFARRAAPDRRVRLALTYAKGNQVAAEGVVSWTEAGTAREAPFISFFLLDGDGSILRERRYWNLEHWPGSEPVKARLAL